LHGSFEEKEDEKEATEGNNASFGDDRGHFFLP
jgi:hypothetical protein